MFVFYLAISLLLTAPAQLPVKVYLTSDDGPGRGSRALYALADSGQVKFTLFIVGCQVAKEPDSAAAFSGYRKDTLLLMANHSYSHANGHYKAYYRHPEIVVKDFERNEDSLSFGNRIARLPGRNCWRLGARRSDDLADARGSADSLAAHGYRVFGWDLEWKDDTLRPVDAGAFLDKMNEWVLHKRMFMPGAIVILFHDRDFERAAFRNEVWSFIRLIRNRSRFRLATLTEYP